MSEILVRNIRSTDDYGPYEHFAGFQKGSAARQAVFGSTHCTECKGELGEATVTFRLPSANADDGNVYLTTVHLGECAAEVNRRVEREVGTGEVDEEFNLPTLTLEQWENEFRYPAGPWPEPEQAASRFCVHVEVEVLDEDEREPFGEVVRVYSVGEENAKAEALKTVRNLYPFNNLFLTINGIHKRID